MIWLFISLFFILMAWVSTEKWKKYFDTAFLFALLFWLVSQVDLFDLGGDEEALLQWFAIALVILIINKLWQAFYFINSHGSFTLEALAAFSYALGLDVFRPDAYARIPAGIIGFLVLIVAMRAGKRMLAHKNQRIGFRNIFIVLQVIAFALMLYASFYKLLDRVWLLPWSYLMALGALSFCLSQIWRAWMKLDLTEENWHNRISITFASSQFLIVVAAYYHYAQYL